MATNETQKKWRENNKKRPVQIYLHSDTISKLDSFVASKLDFQDIKGKGSRAKAIDWLINNIGSLHSEIEEYNNDYLHVDLEQFANKVQTIVDNITPDKGHGIRVYIIDAHKHSYIDMPMGKFKDILLQCHKARYLTLCNANDGQQRSSDKGQLSEIKNLNNPNISYHFIRQIEKHLQPNPIVKETSKNINYNKAKIIKAITPFISKPMTARDELHRLGYTTEEGKKWTGASIKKWIKANITQS
jgi:hypothetical protein